MLDLRPSWAVVLVETHRVSAHRSILTSWRGSGPWHWLPHPGDPMRLRCMLAFHIRACTAPDSYLHCSKLCTNGSTLPQKHCLQRCISVRHATIEKMRGEKRREPWWQVWNANPLNLCESDSLCMPDSSSHSTGRQRGRRSKFMKRKTHKGTWTGRCCICCLHEVSLCSRAVELLGLAISLSLARTLSRDQIFHHATVRSRDRKSARVRCRTGPVRASELGCVHSPDGHGTFSAERTAPYSSIIQFLS
jgi:hypothetical protein